MTLFPYIKRTILSFTLLFIAQVYGQETIIPLTEGGWVGGLSGNVSWDDYKINDSQIDGFGFSISSRNGRFVINDLSVGFDLQWSENELTTLSEYGEKDYVKNRLGFIGLWSRYYIPLIGTGAAIFSEVSLGYSNYNYETELSWDRADYISRTQTNISADGFAYNIGFGGTMFVSNNVAFEITGRYQGGTLSGKKSFPPLDVESSDIEIKLSNIDILFGIMIYLK